MRRIASIVCVLPTKLFCLPLAAQNGWNAELASRVDHYIDQRYDGSSAATHELLEQLKKAGITKLEDLESAVRRFPYLQTAK